MFPYENQDIGPALANPYTALSPEAQAWISSRYAALSDHVKYNFLAHLNGNPQLHEWYHGGADSRRVADAFFTLSIILAMASQQAGPAEYYAPAEGYTPPPFSNTAIFPPGTHIAFDASKPQDRLIQGIAMAYTMITSGVSVKLRGEATLYPPAGILALNREITPPLPEPESLGKPTPRENIWAFWYDLLQTYPKLAEDITAEINRSLASTATMGGRKGSGAGANPDNLRGYLLTAGTRSHHLLGLMLRHPEQGGLDHATLAVLFSQDGALSANDNPAQIQLYDDNNNHLGDIVDVIERWRGIDVRAEGSGRTLSALIVRMCLSHDPYASIHPGVNFVLEEPKKPNTDHHWEKQRHYIPPNDRQK